MYETKDSSNIKHIKYDPETKSLEVCFRNGSIYHYQDVSENAYKSFESAKSHGSYFAKHVKNAYKYKKHDPKNDKKDTKDAK